jgi:hypothetical protein
MATAFTARMACPSPENGTREAAGSDDGALRVDTDIESSIDGMANPATAGCSQGERKRSGGPDRRLKREAKRRGAGPAYRRNAVCAARRRPRKRESKGTGPGAHAAPVSIAGPTSTVRLGIGFSSCAYIFSGRNNLPNHPFPEPRQPPESRVGDLRHFQPRQWLQYAQRNKTIQ